MPKFDVFVNNKKVKVQKNPSDSPSSMDGFEYVGFLIGSTKINALTQATAKVKKGEFKIKAEKIVDEFKEELRFANSNKDPIKKAIYCDVNGVLDDQELTDKADIREPAVFYVPSIVNPHKAFSLLKLAIKHEADLVLISDWRLSGVDFYVIIARSIKNSGIKAYEDYIDEHLDEVMDLCGANHTKDLGERTKEVKIHAIENKYTHFVVFEDYHFIEKELNPIMIDPIIGLTDTDIQKADKILSK